MLSVLIQSEGRLPCLGHTLAALVPAAVSGRIGDVVVAACNPDPEVQNLCEEAGATLVSCSPARLWSEAAGKARHNWLICLREGDCPDEHVWRTIEQFLARQDMGQIFIDTVETGTLLRQGDPFWRRFFPSCRIGAGDVVVKTLLLSGQPVRKLRLPAILHWKPA